MRKAGFMVLSAALVLALARLFTGVVYRADVPTAALVLKRVPDIAIERTETPARPLDREIVVDEEEPRLFYGRIYAGVMRSAPIVVLVMIAGALALLFRRGGRS